MAIRLKGVLEFCKVSISALARIVPKPDGDGFYSKTAMYNFLNKGIIPKKEWSEEAFRSKVWGALSEIKEVTDYLEYQGQKVENLWAEVDGNGLPINKNKVFSLDPEDIGKEAEVISDKARDLFGVKRDPFTGDIGKQSDVFRGSETRFIFTAIKLAATEHGLIAICGHVGAGKTTAKKWLLEELRKDESIYVVQPMLLDKSKVTEKALADAIMEDLTGKAAASGPEKRARQLRRVLIERNNAGDKVAIIIDEAHMLTPAAVLLLKAIHEIENVYSKTTGVVLIGQMELSRDLLNVAVHPKLKPFIARCHVEEINGLDKSLEQYIAHKFKQAGMSHLKVLTPGAIKALDERLSPRSGEQKRSFAFPLVVNNVIVKAMNETARLGENRVTEEIIMSLRWQ